MGDQPATYEASGVSIAAQDEAIAALRPAVEASQAAARFGRVLAGVGSFAAAFAPRLDGMTEPVLVSSADSLGSKGMLHARFGSFESGGRDLVAAVVNDVICCGASPAFFLDTIGTYKVEPAQIGAMVSGMAAACQEIGCALVGGEIAEMRDTYKTGESEVMGFCVGLVERKRMLGPQHVQQGDAVVALASSGVHTNGYTLVRKVLGDLSDDDWQRHDGELGTSLREALLMPTLCYANAMAAVQAQFKLHAAAHISGGGLVDNVPRVLPAGLSVQLERQAIAVPPVFAIIQRRGQIEDAEMWHVFNMGVGFVMLAPAAEAQHIVSCLKNNSFTASVIGNVVTDPQGPRVIWSN